MVLQEEGELTAALESYRKYQEGMQRLAAADRSNTGWQRDLFVSHLRLGDVLWAQGNLAEAIQTYREALAVSQRLAAVDPSNAEWQRDLAGSFERMAVVAARTENRREAVGYFAGCHSTLKGMQARGMHLDQRIAGLLTKLERASGENYASLIAAALGASSSAPPPPPPKVHIPDPLAQPPREISLTERRESACRCFQKGLWEGAAGDLQKLLDASEPLTEHGPKLVTCLLNAHESPLESDVKRIETLLQQLERAGHADLAAPLRQQLQGKLRGPSKRKWWKPW